MIADDAQGAHGDAPVFDETTPVVKPAKAERRAIDRLVMSSANLGIRSAVICNSMIYGDGLGIRRDSAQLPLLAAIARDAGAVRVIGKGLNRWSNVHVADVADLYLRAIDAALPGAFYFAENGEASFAEIGHALGERLGLPSVVEWDIADAARALGHSRALLARVEQPREGTARAAGTRVGADARRDARLDSRRDARRGLTRRCLV